MTILPIQFKPSTTFYISTTEFTASVRESSIRFPFANQIPSNRLKTMSELRCICIKQCIYISDIIEIDKKTEYSKQRHKVFNSNICFSSYQDPFWNYSFSKLKLQSFLVRTFLFKEPNQPIIRFLHIHTKKILILSRLPHLSLSIGLWVLQKNESSKTNNNISKYPREESLQPNFVTNP